MVEWPDLPPDRIWINSFFDAARYNTKGAIEYTPSMHRAETNKHLLSYYYQRVFTQILLIKNPIRLPYAHKQIALWGDDSTKYLGQIVRHHWCKMKNIHVFGSSTEVAIEPTPGIMAPRVIEYQGEPVANWEHFLYLMACNVIVARKSPFIDTLLLTVSNKEFWLVSNDPDEKVTLVLSSQL